VPGKQPRKVPPRPRWRARRINKRVLPNHRPAFQFSGDQYFSNLRSCVHLFDFPPADWLRSPLPTPIQPSSRRNSELIFFSKVGNFVCRAKSTCLLESPKICLSQLALKVPQLSLIGAAKCQIQA
jgi:hypothetical protein